jgi:hypothetical protein
MTQPPYPGPDEEGAPDPTGGSEAPPPTHQPYGQPYPQQPPPYGEQPPAYGQQPYGAYGQAYGAYGQPNDLNRGWSGTAIAALVTSLTCCLGFVGAILGVIGIFRTGEGKGRGRWMAVTGIVVGLLGTVVTFGGAGYLVYLAANMVTPANAEVGMCVDTDDSGNTVNLTKATCSEKHDAEIFAVHEITADEAAEHDSDSVGAICQAASADVPAFRSGEYLSYTVYESEKIDDGDTILCLIQRTDDDALEEKVLD